VSGRGPAARRSIQSRVMTLVVSGTLAAMAVTGAVFWRDLGAHEAALARSRTAVAGLAAAQFDDRFTGIFAELQALAGSVRGLPEGVSPALVDALHQTYLHSRFTERVLLVDPAGAVVVAQPIGADPPAAALDPVLRRTLADRRPHASDLVEVGPGLYRVFLTVPVPGWTGEARGVVVAVLDPAGRRFGALALPLQHAGLGPLVVVDGQGLVVASTAGRQATGTRASGGGVAAPLTVMPWRVVAPPDAPWLGRSRAWSVLLLAPVLIGLALLFAWGVGRSVRTPLAALTRATDRIAAGDLEAPVPRLGEDEIGRLAGGFERMRQEVKRARDDIEAAREALERRVADRTRELAAANQALEQREQVRQQLLKKVITAQEEERKRLARELHDETLQTVAALGVRLDLALAAAASVGAPGPDLVEARALAARTLEELRRLMHDLRPSVLDDLGLVPAIRWFADRHLAARGIGVRFECGSLPERLPVEVETALFRAAQEAITNIARHASAERVLIQIGAEGDTLRLEVEDDGLGFDPATVVPRPGDMRGLGLTGMRERVELFGGRVRIDSAPGRGTDVVIDLPLPEVQPA
jgi:signal transduction histidine kinase